MRIFTLATLFLISFNSFAQPSTSTSQDNTLGYVSLQPALKGGNLFLEWPVNHIDNSATWEIQGSTDGKTFKTIGYVWGAENEATDNCKFKQSINKLAAKFTYYRVKKEVAVTEVITANS